MILSHILLAIELPHTCVVWLAVSLVRRLTCCVTRASSDLLCHSCIVWLAVSLVRRLTCCVTRASSDLLPHTCVVWLAASHVRRLSRCLLAPTALATRSPSTRAMRYLFKCTTHYALVGHAILMWSKRRQQQDMLILGLCWLLLLSCSL